MTEENSGASEEEKTSTAKTSLPKIFWSAYLTLLFVMGAAPYFAMIKLYQQLQTHTAQNDFVLFYAASILSNKAAAEHIDLYNQAVFTDFVYQFCPKYDPPISFFMLYPPCFLAIIKPLAGLTLGNAWLVWLVTSALLILVSLYLVLRGRFSVLAQLLIVAIVFLSSPTWDNFFGGQTAAWLLCGLTLTWTYLGATAGARYKPSISADSVNAVPTADQSIRLSDPRDKRFPWFAGIATGIVLIKMQFAPLLVLAGALIGRWRYLAGTTIAAALLVAWGIQAIGWENAAQYPASLLRSEDYEVHEKYVLGANLRTFLGLVPGVTPDNATPIALAAFGLVTLAVCYLWLKVFPELRRQTVQAFPICASLTTIALVMFSVHANIYDYLSTFIGFIWLWHWNDSLDNEPNSVPPLWKRAFKGSVLVFPILTQPMIAIPILHERGWSMGFVCALLVLICAIVELQYYRKQAQS